jgi:hypothetical protein
MSDMATGRPEFSTLVIAALLILGLLFAGQWIISYVTPGGNPYGLMPWFAIAGAAIVVVGLIIYMLPGRR